MSPSYDWPNNTDRSDSEAVLKTSKNEAIGKKYDIFVQNTALTQT